LKPVSDPDADIVCEVERVVFENDYVRVFDDDVRQRRSDRRHRHVRIENVSAGEGVVILPLVDGAIGLVRTFRYPLGSHQWGLPRGFGQAPDPVVTVRAELEEELGLKGDQLEIEHLGTITPDSGLLASRVHVYLVGAPAQVSAPADKEEVSDVRWAPVADVLVDVASGRIEDAFTLAALALAWSRRALPTP
jgi:8-oxo-dGTP pyrophosphatase MutT (NUDIX family)